MTLRIFLSVLLFIAVLLSCQEFGVSLKNEQVKKLTVAALTGEPENYAPTLKMAIDSLQSKSYWLYNESINPVVSGNLFSMLANNEKSLDSAASYNRQALYYYDLASKSRPVSGLNWSSMAYVTERINKEDKRLFDYIRLAHRDGQYEFQTHIKLGLVARDLIQSGVALPEEIKEIFLRQMQSGLKHPKSKPTLTFAVLKKDGVKEVMCSWATEDTMKTLLKC